MSDRLGPRYHDMIGRGSFPGGPFLLGRGPCVCARRERVAEVCARERERVAEVCARDRGILCALLGLLFRRFGQTMMVAARGSCVRCLSSG